GKSHHLEHRRTATTHRHSRPDPHFLLTVRTASGFSRVSSTSSVSWRITRRSPSRSVYSTLPRLISTSTSLPRPVTGNPTTALSSGARRGQKDNVPSWPRIPPSP